MRYDNHSFFQIDNERKNPVALMHGKGRSFQNGVNKKYLDKTVLFVHTNAMTSCLN